MFSSVLVNINTLFKEKNLGATGIQQEAKR